ncbi:MAG: DUF6435 family protein [Chitinophagales bacterium]|nr:Lacal_2735 family protein [Bacteroidota bacterium]MBK8487854.1 Lacal_2735 family protein [Bacteroidota bacterium]
MFQLFKKDPIKNLQKDYQKILEKACDAQRSGDIKGFALLTEKSEEILKQIDTLRKV